MRFVKKIQAVLTPDLLKPEWRVKWTPANPLYGHCYAASEALYHLLGGTEAGWVPVVADRHWWLEHRITGVRLDPTAEQYKGKAPPYKHGVRRGFLTKQPSKRAQIIIDRVSRL